MPKGSASDDEAAPRGAKRSRSTATRHYRKKGHKEKSVKLDDQAIAKLDAEVSS